MTKDQIPIELESLQRAVDLVGTQSELARRLTESAGREERPVRQGHVWAWLNRTGRCPSELAIHIEQVTDHQVKRSELRPDLYPAEGEAA